VPVRIDSALRSRGRSISRNKLSRSSSSTPSTTAKMQAGVRTHPVAVAVAVHSVIGAARRYARSSCVRVCVCACAPAPRAEETGAPVRPPRGVMRSASPPTLRAERPASRVRLLGEPASQPPSQPAAALLLIGSPPPALLPSPLASVCAVSGGVGGGGSGASRCSLVLVWVGGAQRAGRVASLRHRSQLRGAGQQRLGGPGGPRARPRHHGRVGAREGGAVTPAIIRTD
jgi:hypothetical protein